MGLALEVGILADLKANDEDGYQYFRHQFALLNTLLAANHLPAHEEPEDVPVFGCDMYGYSGLHYLRRIAAHLLISGVVPNPCLDQPTHDSIYSKCYDNIATMQDARSPMEKRFDHLLRHSDNQGFYLPIKFDEVLVDSDETGIEGVAVGSSITLERECTMLAHALNLPTEMDPADTFSDDIFETQGQGTGWEKYGIESSTCILLLNAARHSIMTGAALVFT